MAIAERVLLPLTIVVDRFGTSPVGGARRDDVPVRLPHGLPTPVNEQPWKRSGLRSPCGRSVLRRVVGLVPISGGGRAQPLPELSSLPDRLTGYGHAMDMRLSAMCGVFGAGGRYGGV
jgi:hypothetical protein